MPNFAETCKVITNMLRKHNEIKWMEESRQFFSNIKKALTEASVLVSPYFSKDFMIFYFSSEHTMVGVLLQNNDRGEEQRIYFTAKY